MLDRYLHRRFLRIMRSTEQRIGAAKGIKAALRYVFPDHWSFLLGEVALYAFVVLVATGIYLTFFFVDSTHEVVYHGPYAPLRDQHMSEAYRSVLDISTTVKAGLLIRQTHHWAANLLVPAIVLRLFAIVYTRACVEPRHLTYYTGLRVLRVTLFGAYLGDWLGDGLLSGIGLAI